MTGRQTTPEEFQAQHGHPGEVCRVGEYDGKQTTCVQSWERAAGGREATVTCPYCGGTGEDPSGVGGMCHDCLGSGTIKTPPARETT